MADSMVAEASGPGEEIPEVEVKFRRDLSLLDIVMIGFGPTIGSTIFLLVGPGFAIAGPSLILAFCLNFVMTMFTAMAYMELGSAFPETGGGYMWIRRAIKDPVGWFGGWLSWFGHSIVASFYVYGFGVGAIVMIKAFLGLSTVSVGPIDEGLFTKLLAVAAACVFIALNYRGTRITGRASTAITTSLIVIVVLFIVFAVVAMFRGGSFPAQNFTPFFKGNTGMAQFLAVLGSMGFTFIVFEGYEIIAQTGEECREPEKNIPRAHFIVIGVSTIIFIMTAFTAVGYAGSCVGHTNLDACLLVQGPGGSVIGNNNALVAIGAQIMPFGLYIVVFGLVIGALTSINSLIFSASRVSFAMGRDRALPEAFGRLHPKRRTPHVALLFSSLIIITMTFALDINTVAASADIMFLLLFLLVNWAAIVLRRKMPNVKRYYLMPLFPLIPIAGIATKFVVALSLWTVEPFAWLIAVLWIGLGFGVYSAWAKRERIVEAGRAVAAALPMPQERFQVLVAVEDVNDSSLVRFASLLGSVENGAVTLFHVVEVPSQLPLDAIDRSYVWGLRLGLGRAVRVASEVGVNAHPVVTVSHDVVDAILDATKEGTDVLVTGWKGAGRTGRVLGTNIDKLVRDAPCDVVVFKTAGLKEKLERILVFNAPAWHVSYAAGYAVLIALKSGASITIYTAATTDEEMEKERAYSARLAKMCEAHGVPYEEKFAKVRSIVDAVVEESKGYDLLTVGASEEEMRLGYVFGSVQDQIARRAPTPVLMMRKVRKASAPWGAAS